MQFNNLLSDDDAVSPVIGVILMVAITVILAAVIGTFVLGLGDQVSDTSPQASFTFETTTYDLGSNSYNAAQITHDGGDQIDGSNLNILVDGVEAYAAAPSDEVATPFNSTVTAGTSTTIVATTDADVVVDGESGPDNYVDNSGQLDINDVSGTTFSDVGLSDGQTVRVIWSSSSGGDTATLGKFDASF